MDELRSGSLISSRSARAIGLSGMRMPIVRRLRSMIFGTSGLASKMKV
jgi:hypothetical protein